MSNLETTESCSTAGGSGRTAVRRLLRRDPWENASAIVIGLGLFMLMQPFAMSLYTYSFVVILAGTVGFLLTSHFPD
jgi:hypothetical protein